MRSSLLIAEVGPEFAGWAGTIDGRMICMAPPEIAESEDAKRLMREIVRREGGDCGGCQGCPLGTGT